MAAEVALAVAAALLFAAGTVLQQRAGLQAPSTGSPSGLVLRMARRPLWVAGFATDIVGFVAQAAALGSGRLAVVQPVLIFGVVFALPLGALLSGQSVRRSDAGAALLVVAALAALLVLADPGGGHSEAPLHAWLIAGVACIAACAPLLASARGGPPARRAALAGAGAGILFALSAALTKASVDELHHGFGHLLVSWPPYALAVVGYASMTLNQLALDTGSLAAAIASATAVDPVVSIVLGLTVFHETLHASAGATAGAVVALLAALVGMTALARSKAAPTAAGESPPSTADG